MTLLTKKNCITCRGRCKTGISDEARRCLLPRKLKLVRACRYSQVTALLFHMGGLLLSNTPKSSTAPNLNLNKKLPGFLGTCGYRGAQPLPCAPIRGETQGMSLSSLWLQHYLGLGLVCYFSGNSSMERRTIWTPHDHLIHWSTQSKKLLWPLCTSTALQLKLCSSYTAVGGCGGVLCLGFFCFMLTPRNRQQKRIKNWLNPRIRMISLMPTEL